jgi:hypothetical protein
MTANSDLMDFQRAQVRGAGCSCSKDCDRERGAAFSALAITVTALAFIADGRTGGADLREFARAALGVVTVEVPL